VCRPISVVFDAARRGLKTDQVERGQVVAAPRSIKTRSKLAAEVYVLGKAEGGRHTPIFGGYKPQFHVRTTDVTGVVSLPVGMEMACFASRRVKKGSVGIQHLDPASSVCLPMRNSLVTGRYG